MLSVDQRKDKPFHCDTCGDTYEACGHWEESQTVIPDISTVTWYEYEMSSHVSSFPREWFSTAYHADTLEDLKKRPPERKGHEFRVIRKTLTTEVMS